MKRRKKREMEAVRYYDSGTESIVYVIPVIPGRSTALAEAVDWMDKHVKEYTGQEIKVLSSCTARVVAEDGSPVPVTKTEPVVEETVPVVEETIPEVKTQEQAEGQDYDAFLDLPCDPDPDARTKELIQLLKDKLEYRRSLPDTLEAEIEKDPIGTYKKYSEMIRTGKTRDPRIISRLALLYRGKILTTMDSAGMTEFFDVFETQLQHEMPEYRAYCQQTGETQSRNGMMGFLARKYWCDQAAQAEAKRLMNDEIPDVAKTLLGLDLTGGLPFMD